MKTSRFTEEQNIDVIEQAEAGIPIKELCLTPVVNTPWVTHYADFLFAAATRSSVAQTSLG